MRILTWNILAMRGFLLGEDPERNPGPPRPEILGLMADALEPLELDVIALQEAPEEARVQELARLLEMNLHWCSAGWLGNEKWPGGFPGAFLSRLPMTDVRDLRVEHHAEQYPDCFHRHWGSVRVAGVTIHTLHLTIHGADARLAELELLFKDCLSAGEIAEKTIICGDCNFNPQSVEYTCMREHGFIDTFAASAVDGDFDVTCPSINPRTRIDYIWVSPDLSDSIKSCSILHQEPYGPRAVDGLALSDHLPVLTQLSV